MMGVDEVALDKVGMEEVALDEMGVDEVAITHKENRDNCLDEFHLSAEDGFDCFFLIYISLHIPWFWSWKDKAKSNNKYC